MILKECMLIENDCFSNDDMKNLQPTGIVVHSTGANNAYIKRYVQPVKSQNYYDEVIDDIGVNKNGNHWNQPYSKLGSYRCVHAFIGKNAQGVVETYNTLPYTKCCWGCGSGDMVPKDTPYYSNKELTKKVGNTDDFVDVISNSSTYSVIKINGDTYYVNTKKRCSYNKNPWARIQFEICEDDLSDENYFYAVMKEAQEFCAFLCEEFNLSVDQICSHKEAHDSKYGTNHGDPNHWMKLYGRDMTWFRDEVQKLIDPSPAQQIQPLDIVEIDDEATYFNSDKKVPTDIANDKWIVVLVDENRVVIDKNVAETMHINKAIDEKFLTVVGKYSPYFPLAVGDKVRITQDATVYGSDSKFSSWVYESVLYITKISNDRIFFSTEPDGATTGTTNQNNIVKQI